MVDRWAPAWLAMLAYMHGQGVKGGTVADQRKVLKLRCRGSQRVSDHEHPPPNCQPSHNSCHTVDRSTYQHAWVFTPHR